MKDRALLIEQYEELRDICICLRAIAERKAHLTHTCARLSHIAEELELYSHEIFKSAYELKKEEENEKEI